MNETSSSLLLLETSTNTSDLQDIKEIKKTDLDEDNSFENSIEELSEKSANSPPSDHNEIQQELDSGYRIVNDIVRQNKTTCWPFMEAVDAEGLGLWDYHQKIKEPMWLNKIMEKFKNNSYTHFAEFARDFRIMVENCYRYNTTEHPISKKAKRLEMLFEGKLALLKKDIREKATIAKTSNGRFATLANENNPTMRSGRISVPSNNGGRDIDFEKQSRLVYDFVRCEELALAEDERARGYREHKQQQSLYQQIAAAYVSSLESQESAKDIRTCQSLPEIGLFLHLTEATLKLPPLAMYTLEMSLLTPSDSLYLARIMTSFLCTYYERSLIHQRPPMSFKTWENRLKQRLEKWFELVTKYNSYYHAAEKLLIGIKFFEAFEWKNPFYCEKGESRSFLNFSYHQKATIIKAICDNLTTFQSVQNSIAALPCEQSRAMSLGYDVKGNEYTYFPQFCGDDFRVYRHRQFGELSVCETPDPSSLLPTGKTNDASPAKQTPDESSLKKEVNIKSENSRSEIASDLSNLAENSENTNGILSKEISEANSASTISNKNSNSVISFLNEETDKAKDNDSDSTVDVNPNLKNDYLLNGDEALSEKNDKKSDKAESNHLSAELLLVKSRLLNAVASSRHLQSSTSQPTLNDDSENNYDSSDTQWTPNSTTPRKKSRKKLSANTASAAGSPLRRSSRKRAAVNYTSLLVSNDTDIPNFDMSDFDNNFTPKKKQKRVPRQRIRKKTVSVIAVEEPQEEYGSIEFEMICDSLELLRKLIAEQESEHQNAVVEKKSKTIIKNVASLIERLKWLLSELTAFESHLEKARYDAKIQLKREHDEIYRDATAGRAIQSAIPDIDPWEDELISKNTALHADGSVTTYTPPASIYFEESDEESDREIRRSKRRPKRYESDEDFVLDSSDEAPNPTTNFLFNETNENRELLLPAALEELEGRLQRQVVTLQKMVGGGRVTRQSDFGDTSQLLTNERRTRQKSKQENKVFRKVLVLALKDKEYFGPSLLPLLRTDQCEIGETVERVLAQEAIAREEKRIEREEEQKRKRALKLEILQKNKEVQARRRAAKKLIEKYKTEGRNEMKCDETKNIPASAATSSMWSPPKKHNIPMVTPGISRAVKNTAKEKAENVMVRLQNGKIGQALRFPDGRVIPIMRMDKDKPPENTESQVSPLEQRKPVGFHPHISLSAHRTTLLRQAVSQQQTSAAPTKPTTNTSLSISKPAHISQLSTSSIIVTSNQSLTTSISSMRFVSNSVTKPHAANSASSKLYHAAPVSVSSVRYVQHQTKQTIPVFRPSLPNAAVSQRLTLPSGQVINLVVKQPAMSTQPAEEKSQSLSLGRMFVDNVTDILDTPSQQPKNLSSTHLPATHLSLSSSTSLSTLPTTLTKSTSAFSMSNSSNKPLGIVSPIQIKPCSTNTAVVQRQTTNKASTTTEISNFSQQSSSLNSTVGVRYSNQQTTLNSQQPSSVSATSQHLQLGLPNVTLVSQPMYQPAPPQQLQFVPALVAGSVPLVQPVQFVQTVPLQVSTPVMLVAQGQPHLHMENSSDSQSRMYPSSSAPSSQPM